MQQTTIDQAIEREIAATAVHIPLSSIQPGPNDRQTFDTNKLQQLAADIKESGLQQPITVRPLGKERYEIVCGERRWRAHQLIGAQTIACFIRDLTDEEADLVMLAENVQRVQLNPIEEARGFQKQIDKYGRTEKDIAHKCNVSTDLVRRRLGLLTLISDVQHQVASGHLKISYAECMVGLDSNFQIQALRTLNERGDISAKIFRRICNELLEQQDQSCLFDLDSLFEEKKAEYETEKQASREQKATTAELHAEIARLRSELAAEQELRQAAEKERDDLAAELEQERQTVENEYQQPEEQPAQPAARIIPLRPPHKLRKRMQKPAHACQHHAFGQTYQQFEMFTAEEIEQCQHSMPRSSIHTTIIMDNGGESWCLSQMAA